MRERLVVARTHVDLLQLGLSPGLRLDGQSAFLPRSLVIVRKNFNFKAGVICASACPSAISEDAILESRLCQFPSCRAIRRPSAVSYHPS